jgi:hypothetical protein
MRRVRAQEADLLTRVAGDERLLFAFASSSIGVLEIREPSFVAASRGAQPCVCASFLCRVHSRANRAGEDHVDAWANHHEGRLQKVFERLPHAAIVRDPARETPRPAQARCGRASWSRAGPPTGARPPATLARESSVLVPLAPGPQRNHFRLREDHALTADHGGVLGLQRHVAQVMQLDAKQEPPPFPEKRPVPAAHLSFITNSTTLPVSRSTLMAFESCPPMSRIVRASGMSAWAPMAWQLISVTTL